MNSEPLTPEQIKHWRQVLTNLFGPYALIMPEKDIQHYKDNLQRAVSRDFDKETQKEES